MRSMVLSHFFAEAGRPGIGRKSSAARRRSSGSQRTTKRSTGNAVRHLDQCGGSAAEFRAKPFDDGQRLDACGSGGFEDMRECPVVGRQQVSALESRGIGLPFIRCLRQEGGGAFPQALTAERDLVIRLIVDLPAGPPERSGGTARPARPMNGREYGRCARDRDEPGLAADRFRDARKPVLPVDSGDGDVWCQARLSSRRSLVQRALSR